MCVCIAKSVSYNIYIANVYYMYKHICKVYYIYR